MKYYAEFIHGPERVKIKKVFAAASPEAVAFEIRQRWHNVVIKAIAPAGRRRVNSFARQ